MLTLPMLKYQIVPQDPGPNAFWCRELDGTYTLRTMNTVTHDLQPGEWRNHPDNWVSVLVPP